MILLSISLLFSNEALVFSTYQTESWLLGQSYWHCVYSTKKKKNFAHMPLVNPDRNSEVWYLVKYIQYKNKNKQKPPSPKPRGLYELHIFFWLLIKVFNISLPQNRGHILWQVVVTMGQTAWSTTAWIVLDMEITLDSTVKSSHLSPTYRTIERTHSY